MEFPRAAYVINGQETREDLKGKLFPLSTHYWLQNVTKWNIYSYTLCYYMVALASLASVSISVRIMVGWNKTIYEVQINA